MEETTEKDLWTQVLDFLSQIVSPVWNDLIRLMPVGITALILLGFVLIARQWRRAAGINRPRTPGRRRPAPPPGVHLPGPSRWPFVLPIGAMLIVAALALAPQGQDGRAASPINVPLFVAGLLVGAIATVGWLLDAMREWRHAAQQGAAVAAGHGAAVDRHVIEASPGGTLLTSGVGTLAVPRRPAEPPPGVHMPGPSPWPFFAPLGLMIAFLGLVFGPILLLAGLLMFAIAAIGWYRDAGREYRQTDAGHAPEPRAHDPEQAFPKRLVPVYLAVGAIAVVLTVAPSLLQSAGGPGGPGGPGSPGGPGGPGASPGASGPATGEPYISASAVTSFDQQELVVAADEPFDLTFENKQAGVPHNVAIYDTPERTTELFNGELVTGPATVTYQVPALPSGDYFFICIVHPPMTGTVVAQ
jgi:plastocyanin